MKRGSLPCVALQGTIVVLFMFHVFDEAHGMEITMEIIKIIDIATVSRLFAIGLSWSMKD